MNEPTPTDVSDQLLELRRMLGEQSAVIARQNARIAQLESPSGTVVPEEERSTRRGLLRLAGAAVVGGAAAAMLDAQPAAAANELIMASGNTPQTLSTGITSSVNTATFDAFNTNTVGRGLRGNAIEGGKAVEGHIAAPTNDGFAVYGYNSGTLGYGLVGEGGQAQLWLSEQAGYSAPGTDFHRRGEFVCNWGGSFLCVKSGTPGTWRKIGGIDSAGTFHAITPKRVYDSRAAAPTPGLLATGNNRTVSVANGRDSSGTITTSNLVPAGATAVAANVTITGTTGGFGYLAINPGGNTVEGASTINWAAPGQTIANGVTLTLNTNREITVICNGGGSTHFIIDIAGYYL